MALKKLRVRSEYHHTPAREFRDIFHLVTASGRVWAAPDYPMGTWEHPSHDLLLTVMGKGAIKIDDRTFKVGKGELIWVDHHHSTVSWPDRSDPWEFCWVRVDSLQMTLIAEIIDIKNNPVFFMNKFEQISGLYRKAFSLFRNRPVTIDASLHGIISAMVVLMFESRSELYKDNELKNMSGSVILSVIKLIQEEYWKPWKVSDFAQIIGRSESQFFRQFRQVTGSTPMDWLRRERINHAKRRLSDTVDPVSIIAERVGYRDPYYFSRDFRKTAGVSPMQYREQERSRRNENPLI